MAVKDLNVRIAVDLQDFQKSLNKMERSLRTSGQRLAQLGNEMSIAFTAPLAAIGYKAIESAGDFESLRIAMQTTMADAGYSMEQANAELEALRKAALAPGLDLEQAVKGSIRLQSIGFSAEKSRGILVELANAIALTGGTAEELDSVTKQFTQMISKGKVYTQDLNIIKEAMPKISVAMENAFGTKNAEQIQKMGISSEVFIDAITKQLSTLPRVSGGIKNAIVNAGTSIRQFMAQIGEEIARIFDLTGMADKFSTALGEMAQYWRTLGDETKKTIVQFLLAVAAIGPLAKVFGAVKLAGAQFVGAMSGAVGGLKNMISAVATAIPKIAALSTTMKLIYGGAVVAGIAALVFAFTQLDDVVRGLNPVYAHLSDIQKEATKAANDEKAAVAPLIKVLQDNTASLDQKRAAIAKLQEISPEYFGNLRLEKGEVVGLTASYNDYIDSIIRAAKAKAAQGKLEDFAKRKEALEAERDAFEALKGSYTEGYGMYEALDVEQTDVYNRIAALEEESKAVYEVFKANTEVSNSYKELKNNADNASGGMSEGGKSVAKTYKEVTTELDNILKKQQALGSAGSDEAFDEYVTAIDNGVEKLIKAGAKLDGPEIKALQGLMAGQKAGMAPGEAPAPLPSLAMPTSVTSIEDKAPDVTSGLVDIGDAAKMTAFHVDGLGQSFLNMMANAGLSQEQMQAVGEGMAAMAAVSEQAFQGVFDSLMGVEGAYTNVGRAALIAAMQMVKAALAATLAKAIQDSMARSGHPLAGLIVSGIVVGGVTALFGRLQQEVQKAPKFAKGALVHGPTMAMVGDNPGASVDPEVIAPLSRLKKMMGGTTPQIDVAGVIRGEDLYLINKRASMRANRTT